MQSKLSSSLSAVTRVACYLRVSTSRQAESDLSIPDQRRQIERYCAARGWTIVEDYVEPGSSATDDRRPAFQQMIDAALVRPPTFSTILVHSFSRFFRDQFQFERYVRKLAKNGVQVLSITQDMGDNPMGTMMRQIVTLFDEYQSKENAKHTLRAMCEDARQGYWNGARPPVGYRTVAVEKRGSKIKKTLEIDPLHVGTIRLIFRLALDGVDGSGPMGVKAITCLLNERSIRTPNGGRWGLAQIHTILTRTTYIGQHRFNRRHARTKQRKAKTEHAIMSVPPLIAEHDFNEVQRLLRSRNSKMMHPQAVGGPTLLTGICFCASCGGAMTIRTGRGSTGRTYRYYTCSTRARQGRTGCQGPAVPMDRLDDAMVGFLRSTLLVPERIEGMMIPLLTHREDWADRRRQHVVELRAQADEAERKLRNLYEAVEDGVLASADRMFKERIAELSNLREQAEIEADRVEAMVIRTGPILSMQDVIRMAKDARMRFRMADKPPRQIIRTLLQRVEVVGKDKARVKGSRGGLLKAIASATGNRAIVTAGAGGLSLDWSGRGGVEDSYAFSVPM
ncbi:MAG: serine recombinase [Kaistia sp. SCN 65-12]|nr:MAG: serine recombinase [Kaistia sp. SCN 65-12]